MSNISLIAKEYCLRQLNQDDLASTISLLNIPGLASEAGMYLSDNQAMRSWAISNWLCQHYLWGILKAGRLVGLIAIFPQTDGSKTMGYLLEKSSRGQGLMTRAVKIVMTKLVPGRILAETNINNAASIAILKNVGFQRASYQRENVISWVYQKDS